VAVNVSPLQFCLAEPDAFRIKEEHVGANLALAGRSLVVTIDGRSQTGRRARPALGL